MAISCRGQATVAARLAVAREAWLKATVAVRLAVAREAWLKATVAARVGILRVEWILTYSCGATTRIFMLYSV